jgi:hypothetical protein
MKTDLPSKQTIAIAGINSLSLEVKRSTAFKSSYRAKLRQSLPAFAKAMARFLSLSFMG